MSRPVTIAYPPKRTKCRTCGQTTWRIFTGHGASIETDRDGNKPIAKLAAPHRCSKKEPFDVAR